MIEYPIPARMPRRIRWLRRAVTLAGVLSFFSFAHAINAIDSLMETLSEVEAQARAAVDGTANPSPEDVLSADVLTVAEHFSGTLFALLSLAFLYFPVRYFQLFRRIPKGHPHTYSAVRNVAICQIVVELIKAATFESTNAETTILKLPTAVASPGLLLSAAVLWMVTRRGAKAFFFRPKLVPVRTAQAGAGD